MDRERLARLDDVLAEAHDRHGHVREVVSALDLVDEAHEPGVLVVDDDVDDLRVEDLAELVADEIVDRLQLELAGDRFLDAVDQRELGIPLPGLVEEASVLERDAEAGGERVEELDVGRR